MREKPSCNFESFSTVIYIGMQLLCFKTGGGGLLGEGYVWHSWHFTERQTRISGVGRSMKSAHLALTIL